MKTRQHLTKRLIGFLLCLTLVIPMLPFPVKAASSYKYLPEVTLCTATKYNDAVGQELVKVELDGYQAVYTSTEHAGGYYNPIKFEKGMSASITVTVRIDFGDYISDYVEKMALHNAGWNFMPSNQSVTRDFVFNFTDAPVVELPLVRFADIVSGDWGLPNSKEIVYNGAPQTLVTTGSVDASVGNVSFEHKNEKDAGSYDVKSIVTLKPGYQASNRSKRNDNDVFSYLSGIEWVETEKNGCNVYTKSHTVEIKKADINIETTQDSVTKTQDTYTPVQLFVAANGSAIGKGVGADGQLPVQTAITWEDGTDTNKAIDVGSHKLLITMRPTGSAVKNYNTTQKTVAISVTKKAPQVTAPTAKDLTFDNREQELISAGSTTGGTLQYAVSTTNSVPTSGWSTNIPKAENAGTYYVWYRVAGNSDYADVAAASVPVTIKKAVLTAADFLFTPPNNPIYDGTQKAAEIEQVPQIKGVGMVTINYFEEGVPLSGTPTSAGTYTVKIDVEEGANYEEALGLTASDWKFMINKAESNIGNVSVVGTVDDHTLAKDVALTHDGTTKGTFEIVDGPMLANKGTYQWKFTPDDTTNYKGTQGTIAIDVLDTVKPSGSIKVEQNEWKTFFHTITFGLFYKESKDVTIAASDNENGSGVKSIEYVVSDSPLSESELQSAHWEGYNGTFVVAPNGKKVIYAKITDHDGNENIINSDGIVLYTDSKVLTSEITYTRTSVLSREIDVEMNGNELDYVKVGNTPVSGFVIDRFDGTQYIDVGGSDFEDLPAGDYVITIGFRPQGEHYVDGDKPQEAQVILHVVKDTTSVTIDDLDKVYDSEPVEATYKVRKTSDNIGGHSVRYTVTTEYKEQGADDSTYTDVAPEKAGKYTVRVIVDETEKTKGVQETKDFEITKRPLVLFNVSVEPSKVYDGTTDAALLGTCDISNIVLADDIQVSFDNAKATYEDANVGIGKVVTFSGFELAGADAANYELTAQPADTLADITPKDITGATITLGDNLIHNGKEQNQSVEKVEIDGLEATYTVAGDKATDVGVYELKVTGTGNFAGEETVLYYVAADYTKVQTINKDNVTSDDKENLVAYKESLQNAKLELANSAEKEAIQKEIERINVLLKKIDEMEKEKLKKETPEKEENNKASIKTGDKNRPFPTVLVMFASLLVLLIVCFEKNRRKH